MTWRQVASEADVSASSLTRMAQGSRPDIDTVASLADWASLDATAFVPQQRQLKRENSLTTVTAYLHSDPSLTPAAASALEQLLRATYSQLSVDATDHSEKE